MSDSREDLTCPFCDFVDKDDYFLMQHVELIHPENGESPFIVKDESVAAQGLGRPSPKQNEEAAWSDGQPLLSTKSSTNKYIDCPHGCGESILSDELQVHQDLHFAENMAMDECEQPTGLELSTGPCIEEQALQEISKTFSTDLPRSLRNHDQLQPSTPSSGKKRTRPSLKELFLGSPSSSSPRERTPKTPTPGKTRRLGVRLLSVKTSSRLTML